MPQSEIPVSPRWSAITKLVVSLTVIVIAGALLIRFQTIIGPILLAFIVAYLLHPLASWIQRGTKIPFRLAVAILYLVFVLVLIALLTWGGVGLVGQIQNLIVAVQNYVDVLPSLIDDLSQTVIQIGPFKLDFSTIQWEPLGTQLLTYVEPALQRLAGLVGTLAGSAATTLGWLAFILLVSYFFLIESGGLRERIIQIELPGYGEDVRRLSRELGRIWNAFLRGQMIILFSTVIVYSIVLTLLGVRYSVGMALIAGFANFLPYIVPAINWIVLGLVTYFQPQPLFNLQPWAYMVLVIVIAFLIDQVYNNLVIPRIMADTLKVHPAAILIAAIVAASLFGVLGVIIAAPLLATLNLFGRYTLRKMLDQDPWPEGSQAPPPAPPPLFRKILSWWRARRGRRARKPKRRVESAPKTKA